MDRQKSLTQIPHLLPETSELDIDRLSSPARHRLHPNGVLVRNPGKSNRFRRSAKSPEVRDPISYGQIMDALRMLDVAESMKSTLHRHRSARLTITRE